MSGSKNSLWLVVETINMDTAETEKRKVIDHNDRSDRIWLAKHCYWAFRSGRGVLTYDSGAATREEAIAGLMPGAVELADAA